MPIYVYECRACKTRRDIKHGFDTEIPKECAVYGGSAGDPACAGEIRKVLQPAVPIYKATGFHSTDYGRR